MTNPHRTTVLALLKLFDLVVAASAFVLAVCVTAPGLEHWASVLEIRVKAHNFLFVVIYLGYCHVILQSFGLYRSYRLAPTSRELWDLTCAVLIMALPTFVLRIPLRFQYATAEFFVAFVVFALVGLGTERRLLRVVARSMRRHGRNLRNAIIVGDGEQAFLMASQLARRADLGYQVVEVIQAGPKQEGPGNNNGNRTALDRIAALIANDPIDEVFVAMALDTGQPILSGIISLCEEQGVTLRLVSTLADPILAKAQIDEVDGQPVISIYTGPPDSLPLAIKRLIDLTLALLALALLAPFFLIAAIAIKLDSRGPVFFVQERVGFNRRRFGTYKFRTMASNAESQQEDLERFNEASGPVFKIRADPRVTRVGRWLRRFSLDELPQLINVVRGEMSLVGPRPLPLRDVSRIDVNAHKRRFSLRPGITCLWQVRRREPYFDEWINADMEYIDNWSLRLDFKILLKTIPAVLTGRGAY